MNDEAHLTKGLDYYPELGGEFQKNFIVNTLAETVEEVFEKAYLRIIACGIVTNHTALIEILEVALS